VKIEVEGPIDEEFRGRLLEIAEQWADACAAERTLQLPTG
jgi:hypothetical protein